MRYYELEEKLAERGYSRAKIQNKENQKFIADIVTILEADNEAAQAAIDAAEAQRMAWAKCLEETEKFRSALMRREVDIQNREDEFKKREADLPRREERVANMMKAFENILTPDARSRIYLAEYFKANTDVETKYDNTAFIQGLGLILGGTSPEEVERWNRRNDG